MTTEKIKIGDNLYIDLAASNTQVNPPALSKIEVDPQITSEELKVALYPSENNDWNDLSTDLKDLISPIIRRTIYTASFQGVPNTRFVVIGPNGTKTSNMINEFYSPRYVIIHEKDSTKKNCLLKVSDGTTENSLEYEHSGQSDYKKLSQVLDFVTRYPRNIGELSKHTDKITSKFDDNEFDKYLREKKFTPNFLVVIKYDNTTRNIEYPFLIDPTQSDQMKQIYDKKKRQFIGSNFSIQSTNGNIKRIQTTKIIKTSHDIKSVKDAVESFDINKIFDHKSVSILV